MSDGLLLQALLKRLSHAGFQDWDLLDERRLLAGDLFVFALIWRHVLRAHSSFLIPFMQREAWFCLESDDRQLAIAVLKLMRVAFSYRSALSPVQIVKHQYFAAKAQITLDLVALLQREVQRERADTPKVLGKLLHVPRRDPKGVGSDTPTTNSDLSLKLRELDIRRRQLNSAVRLPAPSQV